LDLLNPALSASVNIFVELQKATIYIFIYYFAAVALKLPRL